jgi:hypothetical protein
MFCSTGCVPAVAPHRDSRRVQLRAELRRRHGVDGAEEPLTVLLRAIRRPLQGAAAGRRVVSEKPPTDHRWLRF